MKYCFLFLSYFIAFTSFGQTNYIQWANTVAFDYNGDANFPASQALGMPDALPSGQVSSKAFRLSEDAAFGTLKVSYAKPQKVRNIVIIENHAPGRIVEIALHDTEGQKHSIYKGEAQKLSTNHRAMVVSVPQTTYKVAQVEININTILQAGWAQIDAIGIVAECESLDIDRELYGFGQANIQHEIAFTTPKENLGENINTPYVEAKPVISSDGKILYFTRQNSPENTGGRKDDGDIYYSSWQNDQWSPAINIGKPINDTYANGITAVSPDGNTLLLINQYNAKGPSQNGASISRRTRSGWSFPESLAIENHVNKNSYADYFLANNGNVLLMAIETDFSYGDQDIYVSFRKGNNEWTRPQNLGHIINTDKAEFSPFLAADDKTLYFASEGHPGYGGSDIFYTRRLDDSWQNWTTPKNLGKSINTPAWDAYYTIDAAGRYAYFVSNSGSEDDLKNNSKDIYRIALSSEFKPDPVVLVSGRIFNEKTKEPISADVIFETLPIGDEKGRATSSPVDGSYKLVLPRGHNYGFMASARGYVAINENMNLTTIDSYEEIERDLYLVPIEVGAVVKLNNIFFERSKAHLLEESFPELRRLLTLMLENPQVEIELGGHTDNQGIARLNLQLSLERVEKVRDYLIQNGVEKRRLSAKAYGGTKPIASNATEETRALNRRVEVTILKK